MIMMMMMMMMMMDDDNDDDDDDDDDAVAKRGGGVGPQGVGYIYIFFFLLTWFGNTYIYIYATIHLPCYVYILHIIYIMCSYM